MRKIILFFAVCLLGMSCSNKVKLNEKQFADVLLEIHRIDAALNASSDVRSNGQKKNYAYYNAVFDKYGITKAEFDSCMYYYSSNIILFDKIYDGILDSLNMDLTEKSQILLKLRENDTINYYQGLDTISWDSLKGTLLCDFDSLKTGEYQFSITCKFDTVSTNKNIMLSSWFLRENGDTLKARKVRIMSDTLKRNYQWKQYIDSTFSRLEVHIILEKVRMKEKKEKHDFIEGNIYGIKLTRPYLPVNTEKRLQKTMPRVISFDSTRIRK